MYKLKVPKVLKGGELHIIPEMLVIGASGIAMVIV